jgi:CRISPR-associated endonuclease/helicase Cas3
LADHLRQVAAFAEGFAREAGADEQFVSRAHALGLLHDFGKYTPEFQKLLRGEVKQAPHSAFGAALAHFRGRSPDLAFAVAGHHGGLPDPVPLRDRIAKVRTRLPDLWEAAVGDCPDLAGCLSLGAVNGDTLRFDCSTRILFSCLVDADRLDPRNTLVSAHSHRILSMLPNASRVSWEWQRQRRWRCLTGL